MKKYIQLLFVGHLIFVQSVVAQQKEDQIAIIRAQRTASNTAITKHDVEGISKYWLPDFVQVRGNATFLVGKDNVAASWMELFRSNPEVAYIRTPTEIQISYNDTLAWETGNWKAIKSYSKGGNYSAMWRKVKNEWKLQAEIFVSLF